MEAALHVQTVTTAPDLTPLPSPLRGLSREDYADFCFEEGWMLATGAGAEFRPEEALNYFRDARTYGHPRAQEEIDTLKLALRLNTSIANAKLVQTTSRLAARVVNR